MTILQDAPARQASGTSISSLGKPPSAIRQTLGGEFLTFRLGQEEYGIDILKVQEIRSYEAPTRIANAPAFLKGVVNLRGIIVPVLDLRIKLGCDNADLNGLTVVIVLNMGGRVVGAVVDSVSDVLQIDAQMVQPAPQMNSIVDMRFIQGIANVGERMLILMDIESILSGTELSLLDSAF